MTTSVDILFKELPAPYAADDRVYKNDVASSARRDAIEEGSYKSERIDDRKNEKSFTEHLDDQNSVNEEPEATPRSSLPDEEQVQPTKSNAVQKVTSTEKTESYVEPTSQPNVSQGEVTAAPVTVQEQEPETTRTGLNNSIQTVAVALNPTELQDNAEKQGNSTSPQIPNSQTGKSAQTNTAQNSIDITAAQSKGGTSSHSIENENLISDPQNTSATVTTEGLVNAKTSTSDTAQEQVALKQGPSQVPAAANHQYSQNPPVPLNEQGLKSNAQIATSNATGPASLQHGTDSLTNISENTANEAPKPITTATLVSNLIGLNGNVEDNSITPFDADIESPDIIVSNTQEKTPILPLAGQAAAPLVVAPENATAPAAQVQHQSNGINQAANNKNTSSKGKNASGVNGENLYSASANKTSPSGQQSAQQSAFKGEISYDFSANTQKNEPAPLQNFNPNGQTSLTTGGLLTTQEVATQKIFANLTAPTKADNPALTKMMNEQITVAINKNIANGQNNFSVRLHPAELGQVDIRLEFLADGKIQAAVSVENEKTLAMLQRDQSALEKALQDGGINLSNKDLNFSLMKQAQDQNGQKFAGTNTVANEETDFEELAINNTIQDVRMGYSNQAIDISV